MSQSAPFPTLEQTGDHQIGSADGASASSAERWSRLPLKRVARLEYGDSLASGDRQEGSVAVYGSNGPVGRHDEANTLGPCLVIGRKGSFGKVNYSSNPVFAIDTTYFIDRSTTSHDLRWLYYAIGTLGLDSFSRDSAIPGLDREEAYGRILALPPLDEQRAIARFLDRKSRRIARFIHARQRMIALLTEQKQAIIHQAVARGLDPDVPLKPSGINWLGDIPAHWAVRRIKDVATLESGHTPSRSVPEHWLDSNSIPWVSLNDTKYLSTHDYIDDTAFRINDLGLRNSSARLLPARAVVFTRDATIGRAAITTRPMAVSQHLIAWLCENNIVPEYLLRIFYAMTPYLMSITTGATLRTIGMDEVRQLTTTVPPVAEQLVIVSYIEQAVRQWDTHIATLEKGLDFVKEYQTRLIADVVTGQLDIRDHPDAAEGAPDDPDVKESLDGILDGDGPVVGIEDDEPVGEAAR